MFLGPLSVKIEHWKIDSSEIAWFPEEVIRSGDCTKGFFHDTSLKAIHYLR